MTPEQKAELGKDLPREAVKSRRGGGRDGDLSYVAGWWVIERANQVFGFDGWNYETKNVRRLIEYERTTREGGTNKVVLFEATIRVHALGCFREDVGVGVCDSPDGPGYVQGLEKAIKEAVTDGLKRALRTFGMTFGLALYDKQQERVGMSFEAQGLVAEAEQLAADELEGWRTKVAPALATLTDGERAEVEHVFGERRRALAPPDPPPPARARVEPRTAAQLPAPGAGAASGSTNAPPKAQAPAAGSVEGRLARITAADAGLLVDIGPHVAVVPDKQRDVLWPAYVKRWFVVLEAMDAATFESVLPKLEELPEALRVAPGWERVHDLITSRNKAGQ